MMLYLLINIIINMILLLPHFLGSAGMIVTLDGREVGWGRQDLGSRRSLGRIPVAWAVAESDSLHQTW